MTSMDEHDTSRDRVVAAVAESPGLGEDRLRLILDALPVPAAYVDAAERYRFNNRAHESWLGRTRSELYGLSVREVFGDARYEELRPFVERGLAGEEAVVESEFEYPDGSLRAVRVTFVPDACAGGGVRGFVVLVKDLTRQKHAEESL